jgi:HlyD family secretion protein
MTKRGLIIVGLIGAVIVLWLLFSNRSQPVLVSMVNVERGDVTASVTNTRAGTVDACRRAGISPTIGGQIAVLHVAEGDAVEKDQLLLELWNKDLAARLVLAERDYAAARARSREACVIADVAAREANRLTKLQAQGLTSEEAADRAEGDAAARAAACDAAKTAAGVNSAGIDVATASLERSQLRAPFDGVVAEINGELGEFVTPSPVGIPTPPTVDLIDSTCLYISAPIDEVDAPLVRAGMPAQIALDAFGDRKFPGTVRRVAPYVLDQEKQARTVEIEAVLDEPDENLLPGYSADVEVILDTAIDVLRLPTAVILEGKHVLVIDDADVIVKREIELGISNWQFSEVRAGIKQGEQVISSVDRAGVEAGATAQVE